jgi:hypothetical protein
MKRCLCLLLMTVVMMVAGARNPSARPALPDAGAFSQTGLAMQVSEEDRIRKLPAPDRSAVGEGKQRKGMGAEFWGGPYWGYGPRWGHPCQTCRAECESDRDGNRCERCRLRCGW